MVRPTLVPFKAEHLLAIASRNPFDDLMIEDAWRKETGGPGYTGLVEDKPIACAGVVRLWDGVGYAWAIFGHDMPKYRIWVTRTIRRALRDIIKGLNLHRVEAQVLESQHDYRRWLETFGFRPEGIAHAYTSDRRSIVRYEWVRYRVRVVPLPVARIDDFMQLVRECGFDDSVTAEWFAPGTVILVAFEDERMIGYATYTISEFQGQIGAWGRNMAIHPDYRGLGLGDLLHTARLQSAYNEGAWCFIGHIKESNPALERIFRNHGARHPVESPLGTLWICRLERTRKWSG